MDRRVRERDNIEDAPAEVNEQQRELGGRDWFALATGLNLSFVICELVCKPPQTATLSLGSRLRAAAIYIVVACGAGVMGTWATLPEDSGGRLRVMVRCGVPGWVFFPAIVLFLQRGSEWAAVLAVVAAALVAGALLRLTGAGWRRDSDQPAVERRLFAAEVHTAPASWLPFGLAVCLYGAFLAGGTGRIVWFTWLLAAASFLFVFKLGAGPRKTGQSLRNRSARLSSLLAMAFYCVLLALSTAKVWHDPLLGRGRAFAHSVATRQRAALHAPSSGYQTVVLWPLEKPEKVIPSPPLHRDLLAPGTAQPWVIPFYGPYWYFKVAGASPGPNAQTSRGNPLKVSVHSTDRLPLLMEAHQHLTQPIEMSCCRAIEVVVRNDLSVGAAAVGLTLTDSHARGAGRQSLGLKPVESEVADPRLAHSHPVEKTLLFTLPRRGVIQSFDEITVTLLPDAMHTTAGRKVAVERFVMLPN